MISVGPIGLPICGKKNCNFLRHYKHDKCQTLHDGSTYNLGTHSYHFTDLDCILRSQQQRQAVLTENLMFLSD